MIDFTRLGVKASPSSLEPRDIFMSLPTKNKCYEYPRDVQSEVWKRWFVNRNQKNTIIKMNTGSGKTIVGLTILKSCIDEGKGPAVYVVPDNYLVQQVCSEAGKLGIKVVQDENDYDFMRKQAILVINIHKLVNGKSVFGMRSSNNINVGSILIDDVHACLDTIDTQFAIRIPVADAAYDEIVAIFETALKSYSDQQYQKIVELQDPSSNMLVPFWAWQRKIKEVRTLLHQHLEKDFIKFHLPLIDGCLETCNCVISARHTEITPKCTPIAKISSFEQAERRIFMSATLADDSVFVTAMGLRLKEANNIITPEKANDLGDRLLIFPQVINKNIADAEIKIKLKRLSNQYNVVIIVPSRHRALFWSDAADLTLDSQNINAGVARLKNEHVGMVILINKYDGIDLPDDACRILVIDGLPNMRSEYDSFVQSVNPSSKRLLSEQIQKVEQGMGRGVRSNNDYCVAVLMGKGLSDIIIRADGYRFFSKATQVQFELSQQLWDQLRASNSNPDIDVIFSLADYSLNSPRNVEWIKASKDALSSVTYETTPNIDEVSVALREAFEKTEARQYREAAKAIDEVKNKVSDEKTKGFLMQIIAEYVNFANNEEAQQILLAAMQYNKGIIRPLAGIQHKRLISKPGTQAQALVDYINENALNSNGYVLKINALLEILDFSQDTANRFEDALKDLSFLLGFVSSRPEFERGKGPDNLWAIGNNSYLVIECKNGTTTTTINKHDCNQLNGSIVWFNNEYCGNGSTCFPIMIHNSNVFEHACSPDASIRIITPNYLAEFRRKVAVFAESLADPTAYRNTAQTQRLLTQFKLLGNLLIDEFTTGFKVK